jgi:hypothetical protein
MSKKYSVFITVLFCLFIFGFGIFQFILPDRDFSDQENRFLSQFKAPTADTLRTGKFMEDFEDYITDQFPLRDQWIQLKALSERTLGKQENNKVYFGTDGQTLFAQFNTPTDEELSQRVGFVNSLGDNLDVPVYFSLVPDKTFVQSELLPANAPNVDDGSTISGAEALCGDNVTYIDLRWVLGNDRGAFYRTDHHWTTMGAQKAGQALLEGMGLIQQAEDLKVLGYQGLPYTQVSDSFYGTTYSSSGAGWVEPDSICTVIPEGGAQGHITVTGYPEGTPIESSLYHPEKLEVKDKYAYFLGGNQPLCVIQNPDAEGGKLLVIRDSYSDSLAPFLAEEFQEVHLFDLRYNNMPLKQYVADNGIDQVLVLYSVSNFSTDINLFKLAH